MSGHSKWSTIKRKKGVEDAKRGKLFTKLANDITVAAKSGGGDVTANPALRATVDKAKSQNMPKANIERAIAKGTGELPGVILEEINYEGYGPSGVAFLINCLTDNKNRTVSQLRNILNKSGGSLADPGSVAYLFQGNPPKPTFTVPITDKSEIEKFQQLLQELESNDDVMNLYHNTDIAK